VLGTPSTQYPAVSLAPITSMRRVARGTCASVALPLTTSRPRNSSRDARVIAAAMPGGYGYADVSLRRLTSDIPAGRLSSPCCATSHSSAAGPLHTVESTAPSDEFTVASMRTRTPAHVTRILAPSAAAVARNRTVAHGQSATAGEPLTHRPSYENTSSVGGITELS
jgi:hypothetical protein